MVQLTEVEDEHFELQPGQENDEDFTDTDSEISTDSEYDPSTETLGDRLLALRDILPPSARTFVSTKTTACASALGSALSFSGRTLWVLTSSALLVAVPWALAYAEDQQVTAMEQEARMREMGGELLTGGQGGQIGMGEGMGGEGGTAEKVSAALQGGGEVKAAL